MLTIAGVLVWSCQKETPDEDTSTTSDNALAENIFNDVKDIADQAYAGTLTSYKRTVESDAILITPCATITHDTLVTPHKITIDFGLVNCLCKDGKYRRGEIIITYTGKYKDSATVITHTFNNYFVNDNQILGTKTVTNNGKNSSGNVNYSIQVNGTILLANNAGTITWVSSRNREWIAGYVTPTWLDDVYLITGSASGSKTPGNSYTALIINPLRKEIGCKHFVSGSLEITPTGKATRTLDYGNGICDNIATVTINGKVFTIILK